MTILLEQVLFANNGFKNIYKRKEWNPLHVLLLQAWQLLRVNIVMLKHFKMAQNCFHFELLLLVVLLRRATWCGQLRLFFDTPLLNVHFYYRPQRSCGRVFFTPVCHSVHGGGGGISVPACTTADMTGGGVGVSVWEGLCSGGVCPGNLCLGGLCPWGISLGAGRVSVHGGVSVQGGCLLGDPPRTVTSGRYTSYWNAFLLQC